MTRSLEEEARLLQNIILQAKQRVVSKPAKGPQEAEVKSELWQYKPVSPAEFITSPHFINDREGRIWSCIIDDMEQIFRKPDKNGEPCFFPICNVYYNVSGIGSGKSTVVSIFNAYVVHLLCCMRDPCSYFGLFDTSILLMDVAPTEEKARDIVFAKTHSIIHRCAWFHETNNLPEARLKSKLKFYKHINTKGMTEAELSAMEALEQKGQAEIMPTVIVAPGSGKISAPVGADLYMGVIDEACSDNGFETNTKDNAGDIFESMNERRASRFLDEGIVCAISSAGNEDRWLEKKMIELEVHAHKSGIQLDGVIDFAGLKYMIRRRPSYVANPKYSIYFSQGKTFTYTAERISEDGTKLQTQLEIPDIFMQKFQNDPYGSLKNICALPTASVFRWITDWNGIVSRINKGRNDPFPDPQDQDQPVLPADVMAGLPPNWMGEDGVSYFCHVDFGTGGTSSSGKDSCGLAIACRGQDVTRGEGPNKLVLPTVHIDLSIRFKTHGRTEATATGLRESEKDLKLASVRDFILWCHHKRNFKFAKITFDNFQSLDSIQILRERGYLVEKEGVTNESYDTMRTLWYDDRLDIFWDEHALKELRKLEKKSNGKIEKSVGSSDDEIECIAKVCELAIHNELPEVKRKRAIGFVAQGGFAGGRGNMYRGQLTPQALITPPMRPSNMRPRLPHVKR
jgi:hypothetical protein